MNTEEYVPKVRGLINKLATERDDHLHMAMGIAGEAGEIIDILKKSFAYGKEVDREKLLAELGDCLFYTCGYLDMVAPEKFSNASNYDPLLLDPFQDAVYDAARLGLIGGALTAADLECEGASVYNKETVSESLLLARDCITAVAEAFGFTLSDVMEANIRKLSVRYPNLSFDAERATNRDKDAEMEALRGPSV